MIRVRRIVAHSWFTCRNQRAHALLHFVNTAIALAKLRDAIQRVTQPRPVTTRRPMSAAQTRVYRNGVLETEGFAVADIFEFLAQPDTGPPSIGTMPSDRETVGSAVTHAGGWLPVSRPEPYAVQVGG